MAKKEISKELSELKQELVEGKIIMGFKEVLKQLQAKQLSKIYLANNCPAKTEQEIKKYADLAKTQIIVLKMDNEDIGVFTKKNFFISVLGTKK